MEDVSPARNVQFQTLTFNETVVDDVFMTGDAQFQSHEQRLMEHLVGNYDSSVRPVYDSMTPVDVSLGLTLTQILDLVG